MNESPGYDYKVTSVVPMPLQFPPLLPQWNGSLEIPATGLLLKWVLSNQGSSTAMPQIALHYKNHQGTFNSGSQPQKDLPGRKETRSR